MDKTEVAVILVVVLAAFVGVFYFAGRKNAGNETWVENQLLVKSGDPAGDIQKRLGGERISVQQNLFALNDARNSAIAIMSSEIVRALALQGKNASAYAIVDGGKNICGQENCTGAKIIVKTGGCNCIFFNESQVVVEGSEKFLMDQTVRVGRLIGFALSKSGS